jgi:hypothetical protein
MNTNLKRQRNINPFGRPYISKGESNLILVDTQALSNRVLLKLTLALLNNKFHALTKMHYRAHNRPLQNLP